jgi:capsular polysaccharide biosynthesis protein
MGTNKNEEIEIDLVEVFYFLKSRLWVIILTGIIFASGFGLVSSFLITPMYASTTKLYILTKSTSITSLADIQLGTQLTQDYMVLIKSRPVVAKVIENLELDMSYEELADIITISNPSNTRILEIKAEYPNSFVAKQIVDEFASVSADQIAKIMDTEEPSIVEEGYESPVPYSPNTKKNIIIGGLLGVLLAAGILVVLHLMDDTVKTSEEVEKYLGLSTLGLIPLEERRSRQVEIDKKKRKVKKAVGK